ncbi:MAG: hypothetical protein FWE19_04220 [Oscillospiraceae bacterium]|nr:hypothetical protein [Oscillospiraceae bacterium]
MDSNTILIILIVFGAGLLVYIVRRAVQDKREQAREDNGPHASTPVVDYAVRQEMYWIEGMIFALQKCLGGLTNGQQQATQPAYKLIDAYYGHLCDNVGTLGSTYVMDGFWEIEQAISELVCEISDLVGERVS